MLFYQKQRILLSPMNAGNLRTIRMLIFSILLKAVFWVILWLCREQFPLEGTVPGFWADMP